MLDNDILIYEAESVKEALKKLNKTGKKVLLVVNGEGKLLGTISDGDIRRYLLKGKDLGNSINGVYNKKPAYIRKEKFSAALADEIFLKSNIELIPILDGEDKVVDFVTWSEMFSKERKAAPSPAALDIPVIIMAGGKGERLEPFSKIFPKPLIPVGDRPIIDIIIDEFKKQGIFKYYLTLNYKGDMIESYFKNTEKDYEIKFVKEETFLGTAGSLKLLEKDISDTFIVSNCDVIVKANFEEVVRFHIEQGASLTVLSAIQHYKIPYGVIKFKERGEVIDVTEKPEYTFTVNTGVYVLSKSALNFVPEKTFFHMTDLINSLLKSGEKVITYPVNENDYIDIGQWEEYKKAIEKF